MALPPKLAEEGRIVLFRSTELPELVGLADRILVFHRGRLALDLVGAAVDDHEVLHAINTGTLSEARTGPNGNDKQAQEVER